MEIPLSPDQEARLALVAERTGRSTAELVQEAVALWEERERALSDFRTTLDEAEASIARGEGRAITPESVCELIEDVHRRGVTRLAAEQKTGR
jgi:predicted transcriptional regulator